MENGSFQSHRLPELDFIDNDNIESSSQSSEHISNLRRRSASPPSETVEALISQNEDLMARLKITLRRMTSVEEQLKKSSHELKNLKVAHSATADQLLIWKEKEKIWKDKNQDVETELNQFKTRFPEISKMEYQLERYKRYQEKVKTTIKPYLQQLKDYAQALHIQITDLQYELAQKEALLKSSERQISALKEEKEQMQQLFQMTQNELQEAHEIEVTNFRRELTFLREANTHLESRTIHLNSALERQDELENLVVALRRAKEEFQAQADSEAQSLREDSQRLKLQNTELSLSFETYKKDNSDLRDQLHKESSQKFQLEEQITSLRYMWTKKCEELERALLANQSLEEINRELSLSLNKLREKN
jgi:chromosome segregation ATPase